jgi:dipeptidyl aminopeptidase/acylaminoacyl peptidase
VNEHQVKELLRAEVLPGAPESEERGWHVVRAAFETRHSARMSSRVNRLVVALAVGLLILAVALSPAGAKVADLVRDVVQPGERNAQPALTSLPAAGRLLVTSPKGPWVVDHDGSKRLLGAYQDAAWSPHGLYVAATRAHQLTALEPTGTVHWSLAAPQAVTNPAWSPSGIRIAYLSGTSLRVVNGDGTDDHLVANGVARVPPAWRPLRAGVPPGQSVVTGQGTNVLAYVDRRGQVLVRDVDTDRLLIRNPPGPPPAEVAWSSDGTRLLSVSRHLLATFDARSSYRFPTTLRTPNQWTVQAASFEPDSHRIAAVETRGSLAAAKKSVVLFGRTDVENYLAERLFAGPGRLQEPTWSPDGRWLLLGWRDADQWLFLRPSDGKVRAVSHISRQFDPGATGTPPFPEVRGWCCAR